MRAPLLTLATSCYTAPTYEQDLGIAVKTGLREFSESMSVIAESTAYRSLFNRLRMVL